MTSAAISGAENSANPSRRRVIGIGTAGASAVLLGTGAIFDDRALASAAASRIDYPFTLGVASGDPQWDGVVLWTRLAPDPYHADGQGGMPPVPVRVHWEVATDERFRRVVRRGRATATPELGHSVHVELHGLRPDSVYYYRFKVGRETSPVGRTRTAPFFLARPRQLRFAFASCANWNAGHFTAYQHMAREDLDFVVHLGDYLYEGPARGATRGVEVGEQFATEMTTLPRYRLQWALWKSDPDLMAAHAAFPWIQTIDDHEVENNWAGDLSQADSEPDQDPAVFRQRRAAAFQALYENTPMRRAQMPDGPDMLLHRRLSFGDLADLTMIDTRQYRDDQPCGDGSDVGCADRLDPARTLLGEDQREWVLRGFTRSRARWHILGNQAPMGQTDRDEGPDELLWMDPWDGYVAERNRILTGAVERDVRNLVVITGDRHTNYAFDLKENFQEADSPTVATEFVGTSITSGGNGADMTETGQRYLAANPHMKFFNSQRGYVRCTLTRDEWRSDFRVIPYVTEKDAPVSTRATYVVEDRVPGVQQG